MLDTCSHGSSSGSPPPVSTHDVGANAAMSSNAPLSARQAISSTGVTLFHVQPCDGFCFHTATSRPGSAKGRGFSRAAYTAEKITVVAPMPSASVTTATAVKPGACARFRSEKRMSCLR